MESSPTDVFSRLESAVSAWSDELQSAHVDLEHRLAEAANKLAEEVEGGLLDTGPILEAIETSQSRIVDIQAAIDDMVVHSRDVEQRLLQVESATQNQSALVSTVSGLNERIDDLASRPTSAGDTQSLEQDVAALRAEIADLRRDNGLDSVRAELQEIRDQISNAAPVDEALVLEFAKVGMEVSQLRSALTEIGVKQPAIESVVGDATEKEEPLVVIDTGSDERAEDFGDTRTFGNAAQTPIDEADLSDDALRSLAFDDTGHRRRLGDILTAANAITDGQLDDALDRQARIPTSRIGTILVELGAATELTIARVLSAQLQLPYIELNEESVSDAAVMSMSPRLARHHQCIPVSMNADTLVLAMANPLDLIAIENVELATNKRVDPVVATQSQVAQCIDAFYGPPVIIKQDETPVHEI